MGDRRVDSNMHIYENVNEMLNLHIILKIQYFLLSLYQIKILTNMEKIKTELNHLRANVKKMIAQKIVDVYLSQHNNQMPNFENEEEFVVDDSQFTTQEILVPISSQSGVYYERIPINEYVVTNDLDLYFWCGEDNDLDIHWSDITTDELIYILYNLNIK